MAPIISGDTMIAIYMTLTGQNDSRSCERAMTSRQCLLVVQISREMKERKKTVNRVVVSEYLFGV